MFCKNCGSQLPEDAKFCTSCGVKIENKEPASTKQPENTSYNENDYYQDNDHYYNEQPNEKTHVPEQFNESYRNRHNKSGTASTTFYEKEAFKGKSVNFESSGSIGFGSGRKSGFFGKLVKLGVTVVVISFVLVLLFSNGDPIQDLTTTDVINVQTYEPVGPTDTFDDWTDEVFITFSTSGVEVGQTIVAEFYIEDTFIGTNSIVTTGPDENIYFSHVKPTDGWMLGYVYRVEIFLDGEFQDSTTYMFE